MCMSVQVCDCHVLPVIPLESQERAGASVLPYVQRQPPALAALPQGSVVGWPLTAGSQDLSHSDF